MFIRSVQDDTDYMESLTLFFILISVECVVGGHGVKLTILLHLAPRLRTRRAILHSPKYVFVALCVIKQQIRLYVVVLS